MEHDRDKILSFLRATLLHAERRYSKTNSKYWEGVTDALVEVIDWIEEIPESDA